MNSSAVHVLIIEDDRPTSANMRDILELDGYTVADAGSVREARALPEWGKSEVVILDRRLPDGLAEEVLPALAEEAPDTMFVIVTGHHDIAGAVACLKCGAEDFILKPLNADALRASIRRALEHRRDRLALRQAENRLHQTLDELEQRVAQRTSELEQANAELHLLKNLAIGIATQAGLDEALHLALEQICGTTGWDCGEAWLAEDDRLRLVPRARFSRDEQFAPFHAASEGFAFERGEGLPGRVWAARKPLWIQDLPKSKFFCRADLARSSGLTAGLGVPIFSGEILVAVMTFFIRSRRAEDARLVQLVTAAVAPLAPVIERKRVEDKLAKHKDELEILVAERTAQLRQADRLAAIGTLAAGLGHDMHNVLLPVRSRLDVIEADVESLPPRSRDQLPMIRRAINYLQELSDGLYLLALDPNDEEATTASTDLAKWWSQVGPLLAKTVPKRVAFHCSIPETLPRVAVAPHRLTQAVLNLLVNSGEAIQDEGEVQLRAESISVHPHGRVRITVRDTGEGMSAEVKRRALDPFYTTKKRGLGTGLGLVLVDGVVKAAGGAVEIESMLGEGTTVTLLFPTVPQSAPEGAQSDGEESGRPLATVTLSDSRMASFISSFLRAVGFDLHTFPAPEAIAAGTAEVGAEADGVPHESALWIVDEAALRPDAGRRFLRGVNGRGDGRHHRLIVVGTDVQTWTKLGAQVLTDASDVDALRRAIAGSGAA